MSELGETLRAWGKAKQAKRASNREHSARLLTEAGLSFESKNGGAHLIVGDWDFWPSTGLFRCRSVPVTGRGVRDLIRQIKGA